VRQVFVESGKVQVRLQHVRCDCFACRTVACRTEGAVRIGEQ
jgi:hypothetical protein